MKEIANFFWHGELSELEKAAIHSFVKKGFDVNLWSYQGIELPGVVSKNANQILEECELYKYKMVAVGNDRNSLVLFSDLFRYHLLSVQEGWWFDTDCFCLASQEQFKTLRTKQKNVFGLHHDFDKTTINNAVLFLEKDLAIFLKNQARKILNDNENFLPDWGMIGPKLLNSVLNHQQSVDSHYFYPIDYQEVDLMLKNNFQKTAFDKLSHSMICHVWGALLDLKSAESNSFIKILIKHNQHPD